MVHHRPFTIWATRDTSSWQRNIIQHHKGNDLSSHENTWKNLSAYYSVKETNVKLAHYMFTTIWHSGEGKTMKIVKRWVFSRGQDFPYSSVDKESTCNAGDSGSTPGSGRSTEEGIGYPLWFSWASLVVQLVKNPPAMQETWVWSLGWEDPLERGKATHSTILA